MDVCSYCERPTTRKGHDPCIANLPGVVFACCGHAGKDAFTGGWSTPYLVEPGRETLYGYRALDRMRELGGALPDVDIEKMFKRLGIDKLDFPWRREALLRSEPVDA